MRNILVPLDGSAFGERALPMAYELARRAGATVHLVHVHDLALLPFTFEGYGAFDPVWTERHRADAATYLEGLAERAGQVGVNVRLRLLEAPIVESIADYAERVEADLIVMTTHGRGGVSRAWLGSVADDLVRAATVPVLMLRPTETEAEAEEAAALRHILVPLDGSPLAAAALDEAAAIAAIEGARVTLVHVISPLYAAGPPYAATVASYDAEAYRLERERAERYLHRVAAELAGRVGTVRSLLITHPHPATAIREIAHDEDVDLIVIASHGRGGVARWALGSVADKLIRSGAVPVLVVRPGQLASDRPARQQAAAAVQ
jgi:nucleotide-binding universal stress UspA family protein